MFISFFIGCALMEIQVKLNNVRRNLINLNMEGFFDSPVFFQEEVNVGQILRNFLLLSSFLFMSLPNLF